MMLVMLCTEVRSALHAGFLYYLGLRGCACLLLLLFNKPAYPRSTRWITAGLSISILGDMALDLQATTLGIGLFSFVMLIYFNLAQLKLTGLK